MIKIECGMSQLHYSIAHSKEMSELGFPVNRWVCWMALLRFQLFCGSPLPLLLRYSWGRYAYYILANFSPSPKPSEKELHCTGLLYYHALRYVYHISFTLPYRVRLILLTILVGNINDPAVIQIGKRAARRAELQPGLEESCPFLHLDK